MIALALALLAGVMISDQLGVIAFAQETKTSEDSAAEAPDEMTETVSMTETVQAVLANIEAADESLFVNLSSSDIGRAAMAITFAHKVLVDRGIPVTIFLNVEGVRLADTTIPQHTHVTGDTLQEKLQKFMADGGTVIICPFCMQNVGGMTKGDLLDGVLMGVPELTQGALFADNATVLSY